MSRPAEELLEFDRLKEIVSRSTTCVPGRRAIEALAPQQDVGGARSRVRADARGHRLFARGFGAWFWLAGRSGSVACAAGCSRRRCSCPRNFSMSPRSRKRLTAVRQTFKGEAAKYPRLAERAAALADFRSLSAAIRRAVMPNGEISDDASPQLKRIRASMVQAREKIQRSLENILRARGEPCGRRLHHAAKRPLRDSGARLGPARRSGRGSRSERHGTDGVCRAARNHRSE